ncbi:MAG TPA: hypothetical protein VD971_10290 [Phycisphaerales bacterium]|nr:hypothetical protein [Phycisphaerales bacterium]
MAFGLPTPTVIDDRGVARRALSGDKLIRAFRRETRRGVLIEWAPFSVLVLLQAGVTVMNRWWAPLPWVANNFVLSNMTIWLAILLVAAMLIARRRQNRHLIIQNASPLSFVAYGRCAACGFDLAALPTQPDGCVVCSECGAAWDTRRITRRLPGSTPEEAADACLNGLRPTGFLSDGATATLIDHAGLNTTVHGLRVRGPQPAGKSAAALDCLRQQTWKFRRNFVVPMGVLAAVSLGAAVLIGLADGLSDRVGVLMVVGCLSLIVAALCCLLSLPTDDRRELLLSHGVCASCLHDMADSRDGVRGCRVCAACGCSWMMRQRA